MPYEIDHDGFYLLGENRTVTVPEGTWEIGSFVLPVVQSVEDLEKTPDVLPHALVRFRTMAN